MSRIKFIFAWYDFWIGAYYDRTKRKLYVLPLPMIGIVIDLMSYYEIIGGYTGTAIGTCMADDLADICRQEPKATFREISKSQWLKSRGV